MAESHTGAGQSGWTRIHTATGRYEYQFQGSGPTVRNGRYIEARDYQFLVMDEEGCLYRIPVCISGEEGGEFRARGEVLRLAEEQLRAGLERFRPRANAPYPELDSYFAIDVSRARDLRREKKPG